MSDEEKPSCSKNVFRNKRESGEDEKTKAKVDKQHEKEDGEKKVERKDEEDKDSNAVEAMRKFFLEKLKFCNSSDDEKEKVIEDLSFNGLMKHWKENGFRNIITMVGAGISTSAGIPDFRSPGSGLYDNLEKYKLPYPMAIFELDYFERNPKPFFTLAKELYPGKFYPTPAHYFIRLLNEKGLLQRHYTQNIDTLDRLVGIPSDKLVEAHGTFYKNHCLGCKKSYSMKWMKQQIFSDLLPTCERCSSIVKPDIVFFGENLPSKFYTLPEQDFKACDLLIIMGTSLEVQPFASLIENVNPKCIRLLINRTKVANDRKLSSWLGSTGELLFNKTENTRDIAYYGDCDSGVWAIADELGWTNELRELIETDHLRFSEEHNVSLPDEILLPNTESFLTTRSNATE